MKLEAFVFNSGAARLLATVTHVPNFSNQHHHHHHHHHHHQLSSLFPAHNKLRATDRITDLLCRQVQQPSRATMAKNRKDRDSTPASTATARSSESTPLVPPTPTKKASAVTATSAGSGAQNWDQVIGNVCQHYFQTTPQRTKLLDVFLGFLAVVGAIQFLYCILAGNYVRFDCRGLEQGKDCC
jgi:oligosaccharyltransferase complex subunit epsilon